MPSYFVDATSGRTVPSAAGTTAGDQLAVKVGNAFPDCSTKTLVSDGAGHWVGEEFDVPLASLDSDWMQALATDWSYLGQAASALAGTIQEAGAFRYARHCYAAGLRLQDNIEARLFDQGAGGRISVAALWYEFDHLYNAPIGAGPGSFFENDGAAATLTGIWPGATWNGHATQDYPPSPGNLGFGAVLDSDQSAASKEFGVGRWANEFAGYAALAARNGGWDDVKFFQASVRAGSVLGGVPGATPAVPSKMFLYPTLYAKLAGAASPGRIAALSYRVRWVA